MQFFKTLLCASCLLGAHTVCAQKSGGQALTLDWGVYIPLRGGFLNQAAAISPTLGWEWSLTDALSLGAQAGLTLGAEQGITRDTYLGDAVTGLSDRKLTLIPLTAHLRWFPGTTAQQRLRPFIGIAVGVQYAAFRITGDQINTSSGNSWGAVARPEIGVRFAPTSSSRFHIAAAGSWQYASNRWGIMDVKSLQGLHFRVGISCRLGGADKQK